MIVFSWMMACTGTPAPTGPVGSKPVAKAQETVATELEAAQQALTAGRHDEALRRFEEQLAAQPSSELRVQYAHALRIAGRVEDARVAYEAIARERPDEVMPHLVLGELARTQERWEEALPHLDRATELAPTSPVPWEHRAVCLWELGRRVEAHAALDRAEALGSDQIAVLRGGMR